MGHKVWAQHGTVRRYRQGGCNDLRGGEPGAGDRCDACKEGMSRFNSRTRAGQTPTGGGPVTVKVARLVSINGSKTPGAESNSPGAESNSPYAEANSRHLAMNAKPSVGACEQAVLDDFAEMISAGENRMQIQLLVTGARIMDNPEARNIHPTTMRQMQEIYKTLTATRKTKSRGRLASVQRMAPNSHRRRSG